MILLCLIKDATCEEKSTNSMIEVPSLLQIYLSLSPTSQEQRPIDTTLTLNPIFTRNKKDLPFRLLRSQTISKFIFFQRDLGEWIAVTQSSPKTPTSSYRNRPSSFLPTKKASSTTTTTTASSSPTVSTPTPDPTKDPASPAPFSTSPHP